MKNENKINGLPEQVACRLGDTNSHKTKAIGGVSFIPYDTTPSRVKSFIVVRDNCYFGIAHRGWESTYQFGGMLTATLDDIANQLQRQSQVAGLLIEQADTFDSLLDDSDCE